MKKIILLIGVLIVIGLIFFAIKSNPSTSPNSSNESNTIHGQAWKLVKIGEQNQKDIILVEQKNISDSFVINFSNISWQFNGHAFCNSYGGDYRIEDNGKISLSNISSGLGKTDCGKSGNDEENKYFSTLNAMTEYEITTDNSGKILHLKNATASMDFLPFQ